MTVIAGILRLGRLFRQTAGLRPVLDHSAEWDRAFAPFDLLT